MIKIYRNNKEKFRANTAIKRIEAEEIVDNQKKPSVKKQIKDQFKVEPLQQSE